MAAPYSRATLLVGGSDYTDYLVPESLNLTFQAQQGVASSLQFIIKQTPAPFQVEGGSVVEFYLANETTPLFSGQQNRTAPRRYGPETWQYQCEASGWESAFYRKQIFTAIRGVTFEGAVNQILASPDQTYPSQILTYVDALGGVLAGQMPFFSVNGAFPGELFDLIANLTGTIWRVIPVGGSFQLQFFDPFITLSGFTLNQANNTFKWNSFQPSISLSGVINTQSLKGSQAAVDTEDIAYFRGDGLSSKFDLPTKPFNNEASVVLFDSFNGNTINTATWFESDISGNYVYGDGVGFVQYQQNANAWIGLISSPLAARSGSPMTTIDITWANNGIAMFGFTARNDVPATVEQFLDAGFYINASGQVFGVAGGTILGSTGLTLTVLSQYRFRIKTKATGGCTLEYQADTNIYTRNWTTVFDTNVGTASTLGTGIMSYSGGFALAMVKTVYPYLGVKLEVDRGAGFQEEEVGIYPIDEDVDAVILEENVIAFFGSDPGPSTIPPAPSWQTDPDYKNIRVTYRRGVSIFATYRDSISIASIAALFGGTDSGIREGPVISDPSITSYEAALARCRTEVNNRGNIVSRITAQTSTNILADAAMVRPAPGESATFSITLPTTNYVISKNIPLRKVIYQGLPGLNDFTVVVDAGYLSRGLRSVLEELSNTGKLVSINENQIIYVGQTIEEALPLTEAVTSFGAGTTRRWGDSRLSKAFTVNTGADLLTTATHRFITGDQVRVSSTATLPSPLSASSTYYINRQSSTTSFLYDTEAHAISGGATGRVDLTTTGSGTHTVWAYGWRYGNHRWNSFMKDVEAIARSSGTATARVYKRIHAKEEAVVNVRGRIL